MFKYFIAFANFFGNAIGFLCAYIVMRDISPFIGLLAFLYFLLLTVQEIPMLKSYWTNAKRMGL